MIATSEKQPLLKTFEQSLLEFPLQPSDKIIVAVSGGGDSVCLLHLLRHLAPSYALSLHVAHLNHGFRQESNFEARFVEELSASWGIPCTSSTLPIPQICKERHLSKQEGARLIRYQFFKEVAREVGARWIALGHTADDQAETFLMRLLRGAGVQGLRAIPRIREDSIIRPLLKIRRKEIFTELRKHKIPYVEDPSNRLPIYLRNRIRHELLPTLEHYNPKVKQAFCNEAELLQDENDFMQQVTWQLIPNLGIETTGTTVFFDIAKLQLLHPALQRRVIRWGIDRLQSGLNGIGFQHIETIRSKIACGATGKVYSLPGGLRIEKRYSKLILERLFQVQDSDKTPPEVQITELKERVDLPAWKISLRLSSHRGARLSFSTCIASFDFDKLFFPLSIRGWRPGDCFVPAGMKGRHKKLQDLFADAKIPQYQRKRIPLLTCPEGILWVIGLRVDERFRATEGTDRTLIVEMQDATVSRKCDKPSLQER